MGVSEKRGGAEMAVRGTERGKPRLIPSPSPTRYIHWMKGPFLNEGDLN